MPRPKPPPKWLQAARVRDDGKAADWLSRALGRAGVLPVAEAELAIRAGRVTLGGDVVREPLTPVGERAVVTLDGLPVSLGWRTHVLALHKPAGVVTHGSDPQGVGTVFDTLRRALPPQLQRFTWHAVGRLDRDTTGLLLFTNDERFVAHATSPQTHLPKRYAAQVGGAITEAKLALLRAGLMLPDGPTRPAGAVRRGDDVVVLTLTEGRFHQVKRMLGAVGLPTLALHREAVGTVELGLSEPGGWRALSDEEVEAGLRYALRAG